MGSADYVNGILAQYNYFAGFGMLRIRSSDVPPYYENAYKYYMMTSNLDAHKGILREISGTLGQQYFLRKKYEECINACQRFLNDWNSIYKNTNSTITVNDRQFRGVEGDRSFISTIYGWLSSSYEEVLKLADTFFEQNNFIEAMHKYAFGMRDNPFLSVEDKERYYGKLGDCFFQNGNWFSAKENFMKISTQTATLDQLSKIAFCMYKTNDLVQANRIYDEVISRNPNIAVDAVARKAAQDHVAEIKRREERRLYDIRNAEIGEKLLYSESWTWQEGWIFVERGRYTMMVTCFIERKEGERYQLRIGDVKSSDPNRHSSPTINGVRVSKGDIIWARPLVDDRWVYGE